MTWRVPPSPTSPTSIAFVNYFVTERGKAAIVELCRAPLSVSALRTEWITNAATHRPRVLSALEGDSGLGLCQTLSCWPSPTISGLGIHEGLCLSGLSRERTGKDTRDRCQKGEQILDSYAASTLGETVAGHLLP